MTPPDPQAIEWLKLASGLVVLCSGMLTILTLVLRKTFLKEKAAGKNRIQQITDQNKTMQDLHEDLKSQIRDLRKDLELERTQISGLRRNFIDNIEKLDKVRQAFQGYFEITRKRLDSQEKRLEIVEQNSEQVIHIGKQMVARIRGGKDGK